MADAAAIHRERRGCGRGAGLAPARAQTRIGGWPSRPVRVISPTATGGPGQNFRMYADV